MQPHAMIRLVFILLLVILAILALSWTHVLPGGWFLRDLIEDPAARALRLQAEHHQERLNEFQSEDEIVGKLDHPFVFLGSSTIERFPLKTNFPGMQVVNRGIGGESTEECLARLDKTLPLKVWSKVKGVVLYSGSINLRRGDSVPLTADRVRMLISSIQELVPKAPILLLGILPGRGNKSRSSGDALSAFNEGLSVLAEAMGIKFLPLAKSPLIDKDGRLVTEMSADDWHLNDAGYKVVASWLKKAAQGF
ncbi:MAG: lysophospholipase L1-like esterase [Planctomycetota bacterium]|jgi:lysophospholipase L1-like esterase